MRIGLIDVDSHNFPNLCLMKLSAYHKSRGDIVEWWNGFTSYDLIYKIIDDELDDMIYDCDELDKEFEKLYFAKRVLSVFQNNDMPIRAAVGLLDNVDIIEALYEDKDEFIGDSDSDTDIWNYVVEHGYRHYDEIVLPGECPEMVYLRIARCILKKGKYAYEE